VDLDPDDISEAASTPWLKRVLVFRETDSTNDLLLRMGEGGEPDGTVLIADRQVAGRGQFGRRWESPAGVGIWMSLLIRTPFRDRYFEGLSLSVAEAIGRVLHAETGCVPSIKPPNDVLVGGRKLCGVLVETRISSRGSFGVVGIGLNVNHVVEDFPQTIQESATSLRMLKGVQFDRSRVAGKVIREISEILRE